MNIVICGRREEGKTTLAMWLAKQHHAGVIAFDPRGMLDGHIVYGGAELEDAIENKIWRTGPIIYRYDSGGANDAFDEMSEVLFPPQFTKGGFSLVVDEAGQLENAHSINEKLLRAIKQHPTQPPREAVTIIQTNHRLTEFNGSCKALMEELYIFQTTHLNDLKTLYEHTGIEQVGEIVKNLPHHHCLRYLYGRRANNVQYEIWNEPLKWFTDIKNIPICHNELEQSSNIPDKGWYI